MGDADNETDAEPNGLECDECGRILGLSPNTDYETRWEHLSDGDSCPGDDCGGTLEANRYVPW